MSALATAADTVMSRASFRATVVAPIVAALNAGHDDRWILEPPDHPVDRGQEYNLTAIIRHGDCPDLRIHVRGDSVWGTEGPPKRLVMHAITPRDHDGRPVTNFAREYDDSISVSAKKTAAVIAEEIRVRLLPEALAMVADAVAVRHRHRSIAEAANATARELAELAGRAWKGDHREMSPVVDLIHLPACVRRSKAHVSTTTVQFDLVVTHETAARIVALLATLTD